MKFCSGKEFPSGAIKSQQSRKGMNKLRDNVELQIEMIENKIRRLDIQKKFCQNILKRRKEEDK